MYDCVLIYYRRKFRLLTSDNMDSWKSSAARKKINRCGKKEDPQARNVREVAKCCVFQCFVCRLGRKVTSLKRRCGGSSAEDTRKIARRCSEKHIFKSKCTKHVMGGPLFEVAMWKNCTPLWREAYFQVKMLKNCRGRTTFWSCDVEKLHAAVARGTFSSQNAKKLTGSDHFLKLRCWKIARRCSERHIFKSKS